MKYKIDKLTYYLSVLLLIYLTAPNPTAAFFDQPPGLTIKDTAPFIARFDPNIKLTRQELIQLLDDYDKRKAIGTFDTTGIIRLPGGVGDVENTGPNSLNINQVAQVSEKFKKRNGSKWQCVVNQKTYKALQADNLATKWQLNSTKPLLSKEEWKNFATRNFQRSNYGKACRQFCMKNGADHQRVMTFIEDAFAASRALAAKNMPIAPDMLIAVGLHESGWGDSRIARTKNNWWGWQAYNKDPMGNAKAFKDPLEGMMIMGPAMYNNYIKPSGKYFDPGYPATLAGFSTFYAQTDADECGGGNSSPTWATKIASVIRSAMKANNRQPPVF